MSAETVPDPIAVGPEASGIVRVSSAARPTMFRRFGEVWVYRELLANLVRKELKVKYKNSTLGFLWSLATPILYLVIFTVVFQVVLQSGIPNFAIYLLCGLLPWTFFAAAVTGGTLSIVSNSPLVTKVWFPREILPLAAIGAALVHYVLQTMVLCAALVIFQWAPSPTYMLGLPLAIFVMIVFAVAVGVLFAALNVYLRDLEHLVELLLLAWFWLTPIVYQYQLLANRLKGAAALALLNPMTSVVLMFQRAIYNKTTVDGKEVLPDEPLSWYLRNLTLVGIGSIALLCFALWVFGRCEDNLAEEL